MAGHPKKGASEKAHVVVIDETGLQLSPLRRRTWATVGMRPFIKQLYGQRKKVSVIGALTLSPDRRRNAFHFQTLPDGSFKSVQVAAFLRELLRRIPGKVIVVWDNGSMHKRQAMRELLKEFPRLSVEWLPPYAPELNPVEQVWSHFEVRRAMQLHRRRPAYARRDGQQVPAPHRTRTAAVAVLLEGHPVVSKRLEHRREREYWPFRLDGQDRLAIRGYWG